MTEEIARCLVLFFLLMGFYFYGYHRGKKSRKFTLKGMLPKQIFAYWLRHEIVRHEKDIKQANDDLKRLAANGVKIPYDLPTGLWFEVK